MGKLSSLSSRLKTSEMGIWNHARSNNDKAFFHYNNVKPFNVKQKRGKFRYLKAQGRKLNFLVSE
jgi:hypothetical protein